MANTNTLVDLLSWHVAAMQLIGQRGRDSDFSVQSTSSMNARAVMLMKEAVRETGRTIVSLIYDVDGDTPRLDQVWLMMPTTDPAVLARGEDLTLLVDCKLWAPANDGPIVIVAPTPYGGHFIVSADRSRLKHRPATPARDLTAGMRRAERRIARLARSGTLQPGDDTRLLIAA